jgi:hypothetical protein
MMSNIRCPMSDVILNVTRHSVGKIMADVNDTEQRI